MGYINWDGSRVVSCGAITIPVENVTIGGVNLGSGQLTITHEHPPATMEGGPCGGTGKLRRSTRDGNHD